MSDVSDLLRRIDALERALANLVRIGTVAKVEGDTAEVDFGGNVSAALQWTASRAHGDSEWNPPDVGEQVLVFAPGGLLEDAVIGDSIFQSKYGRPDGGQGVHVRRYANGASVTHDNDSGNMVFDLKGAFIVKTPQGVQMVSGAGVDLQTPQVTTSGGLTSQGTIESKTDVVFAGTSGNKHAHREQHDNYITSAPIK